MEKWPRSIVPNVRQIAGTIKPGLTTQQVLDSLVMKTLDKKPLTIVETYYLMWSGVAELAKLLMKELGREKVLNLIEKLRCELLRETGEKVASIRKNDLAAYVERVGGSPIYNRAWDWRTEKLTDKQWDYTYFFCPHAEAFRALGAADVGVRYKCLTDYHYIRGCNPKFRLIGQNGKPKHKTLMEGDDRCDFRIVVEE